MLTPLWSLAARVHIKGDGSVRQLVYSDGSTDLATLSGGDGFLNSSATVHATNFVTQAGADMNTIQEMIGNLSATAASQQAELSTLSAEVQALKEFVGMTPPAGPPPAGPPALPPAGPPAMPPSPRLFTGGYGRPFGHNGRSWANLRAFAALASDGSIQAWGDSRYGGTGAPSGTGFTSIFSTRHAFAALASDCSIQAWGDSRYGGTAAPSGTGFTMFVSDTAHNV